MDINGNGPTSAALARYDNPRARKMYEFVRDLLARKVAPAKRVRGIELVNSQSATYLEEEAMRQCMIAFLSIVLLAVGVPAIALINPHFTPIHLVKQLTLIAVVKPSVPDAKGRLTAKVVKCLKGKSPADKVTIELVSEWGKPVAKDIASVDDGLALLFFSKGEGGRDTALLHLAGNWFRLKATGEAAFATISNDTEMRGTWAGGSDMLATAVEYILSSPDPVVPVAVGCAWSDRKVLGKVDGPVNAAQAIDLAGKGQIALFVAADQGARVYRYDKAKKDFADAAAALKLVSKSKLAAWA